MKTLRWMAERLVLFIFVYKQYLLDLPKPPILLPLAIVSSRDAKINGRKTFIVVGGSFIANQT